MTSDGLFKLRLTMATWGLAWFLSLLVHQWGSITPMAPPWPVLLTIVWGPGVVAALVILGQWAAARQNQSSRMK